MSFVPRALSPARLLGAAVVAVVLTVAAALVVSPSPHRHDLAVSDDTTAPDPTGEGYWLVGADGGVFAFDAPFLGPAGVPAPSSPVVGIAATPSGHGYWVAGSDGGVFAYGDAAYLGGMSGHPLTHPIVGI